jgi:hypothetical protein
VSVKGGTQVHPTFVRDLHGAVTTEKAEMGVLINLGRPDAEDDRSRTPHGQLRVARRRPVVPSGATRNGRSASRRAPAGDAYAALAVQPGVSPRSRNRPTELRVEAMTTFRLDSITPYHPTELTVSMRCPACRQQGTFETVEINDLQGPHGNSYVRFGQRRCPNPECHANVFFVADPGGVITAWPPEVIDFDSTNIPPRLWPRWRKPSSGTRRLPTWPRRSCSGRRWGGRGSYNMHDIATRTRVGFGDTAPRAQRQATYPLVRWS